MVWDIRVVVEIVAVVAVVLLSRSPANRRRYAESCPHERDSPAPSAPVHRKGWGRVCGVSGDMCQCETSAPVHSAVWV